MLMKEYKISEEIYKASLLASSDSFSISDDIFEESTEFDEGIGTVVGGLND